MKHLPKNFGHFIDGKFVESVSKKTFKVINPQTEEVICEVSEGFKEDVDLAVEAAEKATELWEKVTPTKKMKLLLKLADLIERDQESLAILESFNNGSPFSLQKAIVETLPDEFRYYAGFIDKMDGRVVVTDSKNHVYTTKDPIGICGIIIPWNLPLWALTVKLAPCLAMGNTCVIKPSEKTPLTALRIAELCKEAGIPDGVVNIVNGFGPSAGNAIGHHMKIRKIAFTGSPGVGRILLEASAKSNLKRIQLELGGKSPVCIDEECDMTEAVNVAVTALFSNNGQLCTAGSRTYVHEKVYEEFVTKVVEKVKTLKVGDQMSSQIGPIVDEIQFKRVLSYIEKGKNEGAKLECGGSRFGEKGYFISPTVFSDVKNDSVIAQEEIFGPVMSIIKYSNLDDAIKQMNNTEYGLAGSIITKNVDKLFYFSKKLQSGTVWLNTYHNVYRNSEFGGFKQSGFGRDGGVEGVNEWTITKTVILKLNM